MHSDQESYFCRVCGKRQDEPIWGEDGQSPTFDICDCCGAEFGYEDCNLEAIHAFRGKWLQEGNKWWNPKTQPQNWSLEEQMKNIPEKYR
jgi:hypothetical protein